VDLGHCFAVLLEKPVVAAAENFGKKVGGHASKPPRRHTPAERPESLRRSKCSWSPVPALQVVSLPTGGFRTMILAACIIHLNGHRKSQHSEPATGHTAKAKAAPGF